jgi:uncharacterized Tic20 family protein
MSITPTTEDRIWAVISHLSSLALGMGIVLPIIGWSDQRRKSNYASFQSLQALGYQSLGFTIWILFYLVIIIVASIILLAMLGSRGGSSQNMDAVLDPWMIIIFIVVLGFFAIYFLLPIFAAFACALGKDFRYPIIGDRLERYLEYDPNQNSDAQRWPNEDHEFRWVAAMGHFSILILLWGILAPLTAWILQGKRSPFLKFQSMQTVAYQAVVNVLYFGALFIYMLGFFAFVAVIGLVEVVHDGGLPLGMFSLVVFIGFSLLAFVIFLLIPLFHILGQWAGYRVLKGDDYRYPLIGRVVEQWISNKTSLPESTPPRTLA